MSVSVAASLRPLQGRCLRHATTGLLSMHVTSRSASFQLRAVVALQPAQRRLRSGPSSGGRPGPDQPKITFRRFAGRALGAGLRNLAAAFTPAGIRSAYRDSPILTTVNIGAFIFLVVFGTYTVTWFIKSFYNSEFSKFPEPVANTLRRAIYFSFYRPDPERALRFYKKALDQCNEVGLDPFSDEVLGIRIQVSFWLEKIENYKGAVEVLNLVLKDCQKWLGVMDQGAKDGNISKEGKWIGSEPEALGDKAAEVPRDTAAPSKAPEEAPVPETLWHKRQRLLAKAVSISVKLGELYSDEHVLDPDESHSHLLWAVETSLAEFQRRNAEGLKPGEDTWLSPEELGGSMESLGQDYERRSQFHLAIPLFFQALRLCESPCHRAVIMNNLSASFAQHPIYSPAAAQQPSSLKELFASALPATRKECLEAGLNWAQNAYTHAKDVAGSDRTPECDQACAVALCNWADVAAMLGDTAVARRKYEQCVEMSGRLGFPEGVKQAREGLAKLAPASR